MAAVTDRSLSRRDTALFAICLGLSIIMLLTPEPAGEAVATALRSTALRPLLWVQEWAEASRTSQARFEAVRLERDSAAHAAQMVPALRDENARLRSLLGLARRLPGSYVPADVLHQSSPTDGRTLLIAVGSREGVHRFDPVVGPEGLIGMVRSVGREISLVITWAHPEFRASGYAEPGAVFGVVGPAAQSAGSSQLLQLAGVAVRDTVPAGTQVVTSGLGGVYPAGIPIGTVLGPAVEETGWERVYLLRPASHPESASQVLVLHWASSASLQGAFAEDSTNLLR
jgi:rod shape-determining protein MreC